MKTILTYATLFASIAGLEPAHGKDAPTLKEGWQVRAEARPERQGLSHRDEILDDLAWRLHQAFKPPFPAKKTVLIPSSSTVGLRRQRMVNLDSNARLPGWKKRRRRCPRR